MTLMVRGMTTIMSFEISSSRLRDERRLVSRQELISVAIEVLQLVYEHLAVTSDEALSPDLLHLWAHYRKSSIVNGYTNKFKLWIEYCKRAGESLLPHTTDTQPKCMTPRLKPKAARDSSIDSSIERKNVISSSKTKNFKSTKFDYREKQDFSNLAPVGRVRQTPVNGFMELPRTH